MFLKKNARGNSLTKLLKNTDLQEIMSQLNQKSINISEIIWEDAGSRSCCLYLYFSCTVFLLLLLQNTGSLNLFRMFFWALKQFPILV